MPEVDLSVIGKKRGPEVHAYSQKDVILYALGVGAQVEELSLVYENAPGGLKVLPTFGLVTGPRVFPDLGPVDWPLFIHGEQRIRLFNPYPSQGRLVQESVVQDIFDKGKGALYIIKISGRLEDGTPVYEGWWTAFYLGAGGFGGDPGPKQEPLAVPAGKEPDFRATCPVAPNQAALYRLCGDMNPLHIDPQAAARAGFERPILHGLCTFGITARVIVNSLLGGEVAGLKELKARFAAPVYPGDLLTIEGWQGRGRYLIEARTQSGVVLSNAYAVVEGLPARP